MPIAKLLGPALSGVMLFALSAAADDAQFGRSLIAGPAATMHVSVAEGQAAERLYREAFALERAGHTARALEKLWEGLGVQPRDHRTRDAAARLLVVEGRIDEAEGVLDDGLRLEPAHVPFVQLRARLYAERGQDREALALLFAAAPELADAPDYYALRAALLARNGEPEQAAQLYVRVLSVAPERAAWWLGLGLALDAATRNEDAQRALAQALRGGTLDAESRRFAETRLRELGSSP